MLSRLPGALAALLIAASLIACEEPSPSPSPSPIVTLAPTPVPIAVPTVALTAPPPTFPPTAAPTVTDDKSAPTPTAKPTAKPTVKATATPSAASVTLIYRGVTTSTSWYYQGATNGTTTCQNAAFVPGTFSAAPTIVNGPLKAGDLVGITATLYNWQNAVMASGSCPDHMANVSRIVDLTNAAVATPTPTAAPTATPSPCPTTAYVPGPFQVAAIFEHSLLWGDVAVLTQGATVNCPQPVPSTTPVFTPTPGTTPTPIGFITPSPIPTAFSTPTGIGIIPTPSPFPPPPTPVITPVPAPSTTPSGGGTPTPTPPTPTPSPTPVPTPTPTPFPTNTPTAPPTAAPTPSLPPYEALVMTDHPVAFWPLNDNAPANGVMTDVSGNGLNGTYGSGAGNSNEARTFAIVNNDSGFAVAFPGGPWTAKSIATCCTAGTAALLQPTSSVSVEEWGFTTFASTLWSQSSPFSYGANNGFTPPYNLTLNSSNHFVFAVTTAAGGGTQFSATSTTAFTPYGGPYHVVGTYDGTNVRIYVNCNSPTCAAQGTTAATGVITGYQNMTGLAVGGALQAVSGLNTFAGVLQDVAVYSAVIAPSRINAHYVEGSGAVGLPTPTPTPAPTPTPTTTPTPVPTPTPIPPLLLVQTAPVAVPTGRVLSVTPVFATTPAPTDLLLACVFAWDPLTVTPPTGWNLAQFIDTGTSQGEVFEFWKFAGASEPTSVTFTETTTNYMSASLREYSGVNQTTPFAGQAAAANSATAINPATISATPTVPGTLPASCFGINTAAGVTAHTTGASEDFTTYVSTQSGNGFVPGYNGLEGQTGPKQTGLTAYTATANWNVTSGNGPFGGEVLSMIAPQGVVVPTPTPSPSPTPSPVPTLAGACSPSNYTGITNTAPLPANFCAYSTIPFRNFVGPTPAATDAANSAIIQAYAAGTASNAEYFTTYSGTSIGGTGIGGYPVYVATASDPSITVDCTISGVFCTTGSPTNGVAGVSTTNFGQTFHVPAIARPGSTDTDNSGDENISVVQPDGTVLNLYFYGCNSWSNWTSGMVVGDSLCGGAFVGADWSNLTTGNGVNSGNIDGGDDFMALIPHYNEVVGGTINHALELRVTCITGSRFPGAGALSCSGVTGVPSGAHVHLRMTHAQILALGVDSHLLPFYYALSDYGGFVFDTSGGTGSLAFVGPLSIEDASPLLRSGATNPWIPWFTAQSGTLPEANASGNYYYLPINFFGPIQSNLEVLSLCHDNGSC